MTANGFQSSLRKILFTDAATCAACGALMTLAAMPLAALTAIPVSLLFYAGLSLFPIAGYMAFVAARASDSTPALWVVVGGNALWVLASLWLMLSSTVRPNLLGLLFIGLQAAVVAVLTALEMRFGVNLFSRPSRA